MFDISDGTLEMFGISTLRVKQMRAKDIYQFQKKKCSRKYYTPWLNIGSVYNHLIIQQVVVCLTECLVWYISVNKVKSLSP